jgi:hypothetical protein
MHFLYLFILQFLYNSTCFERPFCSSSGVHDLLYSASVYKLYPYLYPHINKPTRCTFCIIYSTIFVQLYMFRTTILFIIRSSWFFCICSSVQDVQTCLDTPDVERIDRSKHVELYKNCRITTYSKCILLVCLYNWLRYTVHLVGLFI